jgi:hypothetical protein
MLLGFGSGATEIGLSSEVVSAGASGRGLVIHAPIIRFHLSFEIRHVPCAGSRPAQKEKAARKHMAPEIIRE